MAVIGCIIGETATDYKGLLASRLVTGFSTSAYESIVIASIGDLFFVHERGARVSFVNFILAAISNGVAIIAGPITANLGWHYNFHILLPFIALQFLGVVLFVPETTYLRNRLYDTDVAGAEENLGRLAQVEARADRHKQQEMEMEGMDHGDEKESSGPQLQHQISHLTVPGPRKSFVQRLKPYNGTFTSDSLIKLFFGCFVLLLNAGIAYNVFISGLIM